MHCQDAVYSNMLTTQPTGSSAAAGMTTTVQQAGWHMAVCRAVAHACHACRKLTGADLDSRNHVACARQHLSSGFA